MIGIEGGGYDQLSTELADPWIIFFVAITLVAYNQLLSPPLGPRLRFVDLLSYGVALLAIVEV